MSEIYDFLVQNLSSLGVGGAVLFSAIALYRSSHRNAQNTSNAGSVFITSSEKTLSRMQVRIDKLEEKLDGKFIQLQELGKQLTEMRADWASDVRRLKGHIDSLQKEHKKSLDDTQKKINDIGAILSSNKIESSQKLVDIEENILDLSNSLRLVYRDIKQIKESHSETISKLSKKVEAEVEH